MPEPLRTSPRTFPERKAPLPARPSGARPTRPASKLAAMMDLRKLIQRRSVAPPRLQAANPMRLASGAFFQTTLVYRKRGGLGDRLVPLLVHHRHLYSILPRIEAGQRQPLLHDDIERTPLGLLNDVRDLLVGSSHHLVGAPRDVLQDLKG